MACCSAQSSRVILIWNYFLLTACEPLYMTEAYGTIRSPNHPQMYPPNTESCWTVTVEIQQVSEGVTFSSSLISLHLASATTDKVIWYLTYINVMLNLKCLSDIQPRAPCDFNHPYDSLSAMSNKELIGIYAVGGLMFTSVYGSCRAGHCCTLIVYSIKSQDFPTATGNCRLTPLPSMDAALDYSLFFITSRITRSMGPTWGTPGADRTQVGSMLATWTSLSEVWAP